MWFKMKKFMLEMGALPWRKKLVDFFIIVILTFVISFVFNLTTDTEVRFSPTMEEAFSRHSSGRRDMGEILFIDDHGYNLTVFHVVENQSGGITRFVSHYIRELQDGAWVYSCIIVNTNSLLSNLNEASIDRNVLTLEFLFNPVNRIHERYLMNHPFNRIFGRWPLYGFTDYSNIHNLVINGQSPDYIIEAGTNVRGDQVYFWYFSNFIFNEGDKISISFEG